MQNVGCRRGKVLVHQYVVDVDKQAVVVERVVVAAAGVGYGVGHAFGQRVVGVRLCNVVEIAANHGGVGRCGNDIGYGACLDCPQTIGRTHFLRHVAGYAAYVVAVEVVGTVFIALHVARGEFVRFQMVVEHAHGVGSHHDIGIDADIVGRWVCYFLLVHNRVFRKCGDTPPKPLPLVFVPQVAVRIVLVELRKYLILRELAVVVEPKFLQTDNVGVRLFYQGDDVVEMLLSAKQRYVVSQYLDSWLTGGSMFGVRQCKYLIDSTVRYCQQR